MGEFVLATSKNIITAEEAAESAEQMNASSRVQSKLVGLIFMLRCSRIASSEL